VEQCSNPLIGHAPIRRGVAAASFSLLAALAAVIFGCRAALSYYVDVLWFGSLGYADVFRKTLSLQSGIFTASS
jgi:uncharacterized membrane protein (UPF0182 family)